VLDEALRHASQLGAYATEILRVYGHPQLGPIVIGTDNSANLTLSLGTATPGKAKHALKRWATIRARVRQGIITIAKVDTASMPVDFMTKWKGRKQTDTAVAYITNAKNQITASAEASALEAPTTKIDAIPYIWNRDATTMAIKMEPFVLIELDTRALHKPLGLLADTDPWPTAQTKQVAARLDDNGLPGPLYYRDRCNFQTNHEGLIDSDDDLEIPAEYSYQYSDRSYEDQ
jgi:hypothetical protein